MYRASMDARREFAIAEIGSRWGTWAFRGAAAARRFNPSVELSHLYLQDICQEACDAARDVAALNGMTALNGVTLEIDCLPVGEGVSARAHSHVERQARNLVAWARQRSVIDVLDMDCQGCQLHLLTTFRDVLQGDVLHKTKVLIIGTHDEDGKRRCVTPCSSSAAAGRLCMSCQGCSENREYIMSVGNSSGARTRGLRRRGRCCCSSARTRCFGTRGEAL